MKNVTDRIAGATTTLLCGPSMDADLRYICTDLLQAGIAAGRTVVWVSYTRSPEDLLEHLPGSPEDVRAILSVGDTIGDPSEGVPVEVDVVSRPGDLTALGIKLNQYLVEDEDLFICFDSVTAMLQYVPVETAYQFLHTVTTHFAAAGARAHLHVDRSAHDPATIDSVASLCDAIVDLDEDPMVRSRWDRPA